MKLKKFKTQIFAGLNDREVSFADGLNILLGPNEAGKSSIINGIFATLFKEPQLRSRAKRDIEFNQKFLPHPDGEYIHGNLIIDDGGDSYRIEKKWSRNNPSALLELPGGNIIDDTKKIENTLTEILLYGESTYDNIVFVKQSEVKAAVKRIAEDSAVKTTVNNFLRKAVMEMDGIVTEKVKEKITSEKDDLLSRWDLDKKQPENPDKDINDPYKTARGKIYNAYIERAEIKQKIRKAENSEEKIQAINNQIERLEAEIKETEQNLARLEEIEADINKRIELEPKLARNQERLEALNEINAKWPVLKDEIARQQKQLEEYNQELEQLNQEKAAWDKLKKKEELEEKLNKIEQLTSKIAEANQQQEKFAVIDEAKVEELADLENKISNIDAQLSASKLKAKIIKSPSSTKIVKGVDDEEVIEAGREIEADGYLRIYNDEIDIEVSSAEIDFADLKEDYNSATEKYNQLIDELKALNISNSREAREKVKAKNELQREIKQAQKEQDKILADTTLEALKEEYESIEVDDDIREKEVIEKEIASLKDDKISDLKVEIGTSENKLKEWQEEYNSLKELQSEIEGLKTEIYQLEKQLAGLAELPEEFASNDQFRQRVKDLRKIKESKTNRKNEKDQELIEIQKEMPEESLEELEENLEKKQRRFQALEERAWRLLKVEEAFNETLKGMDKQSFEPLIESFSNHLNTLTAGSYQASNINDNFDIEIIKEADRQKLPVDLNLLSFGTYDSVALALRFALYENLFKDKPGFIILDDCLVNLDPERTEKAIELIKAFAEKYQIIYSTCDPETAESLAGNLINL
ncbi:MAG: AAA family ATPase [Bacillota bacterium]